MTTLCEMDTKRKRNVKSETVQVDGKSNEGNNESCKKSIFMTLFFTAWIFVIVEKCVSGHWEILTLPRFTGYSYTDLDATLIVFGWFGVQCVLYVLPIGGELVDGLPVKETGVKLKYRLNAFFVLTLNILGLLGAIVSGFNVTMVSDKILQMATSGVLLVFLLSIILFIKGDSSNNTGNAFNDWFNGRELNPRWRLFDLKYVCFRSGIIGWMLLNFINMSKTFETKEGPTLTLLLVTGFQLLYVVDYFWFEDGLLVTRDIVHEYLGYNLLVQFLMIPFCFAVQTRYLMMTGHTLPWYCLLTITILNICGYWIYRGSNSEKNNFRKNPNDLSFTGYEVIQTSTGKNLLVSGWWGLSRHPNYLGDIIISLTYALPTGFNHLLPYLNPAFLIVMLVDRERKDGDECSKRYGEAWNIYCHRVKYRMIPYVY